MVLWLWDCTLSEFDLDESGLAGIFTGAGRAGARTQINIDESKRNSQQSLRQAKVRPVQGRFQDETQNAPYAQRNACTIEQQNIAGQIQDGHEHNLQLHEPVPCTQDLTIWLNWLHAAR